jgi:hypothetical protein
MRFIFTTLFVSLLASSALAQPAATTAAATTAAVTDAKSSTPSPPDASSASAAVEQALPSPKDDAEVVSWVKDAWTALAGGNYKLAAGGILMLALYLLKRLRLLQKFIAADKTKWWAMGLAIATSCAVGLKSGAGWLTIGVTSLTIGLTAIGAWELLGPVVKGLLGSSATTPPPPPSPPTPPQ